MDGDGLEEMLSGQTLHRDAGCDGGSTADEVELCIWLRMSQPSYFCWMSWYHLGGTAELLLCPPSWMNKVMTRAARLHKE